jgi:hypothetical protein
VSKRLGSPYRSGRSAHWVKVKNPKRLPSRARRKRIGADDRTSPGHYVDFASAMLGCALLIAGMIWICFNVRRSR